MSLVPTEDNGVKPERVLRYLVILGVVLLVAYAYQEARRWVRGRVGWGGGEKQWGCPGRG